MVCIYCSSKLQVSNSRPLSRINGTWRRRVCTSCKSVITTVEAIDYTTALSMADRTNHLEPFKRDVLLISVFECLKHRKTAYTDAPALTDSIIGKLLTRQSGGMLKRADLINITAETLKRFDRAAAVQYLAYHKA